MSTLGEESRRPAEAAPAPLPSLPTRRPFQFGLKAWIGFITLVSIGLGVVGRGYNHVRQQQAAIDTLGTFGFSVTYQVPTGFARLIGGEGGDTWPLWQRHLLLNVDGATQSPVRFMGRVRGDHGQLWNALARFPQLELLSLDQEFPDGLRLDAMPFRSSLKSFRSAAPLTRADIEQIARCPRLVEIQIRPVMNSAPALVELAKLEQVESLTLSLTTAAPVKAWERWSKLRTLSIADASATTGEDWQEFVTRNRQLRQVTIRRTTATFRLCDALGQSQQLKSLDLADSDVSDGGIESLAALPHLTTLALGGTRVTGIGFEKVEETDWPLLRTIDLKNARVDAAGIQAMAKIASLRRLELTGNRLDDAAFVESPTPFRMGTIYLSATEITNATIERLVSDGVTQIVAQRTFATPNGAARFNPAHDPRIRIDLGNPRSLRNAR